MDLTLQIIAVGDTTAREISAASRDVRDALGRVPGIARIQPRQVAAPDHSKGGLADALGEFVVSAAPTVLKVALQILQAVLSRHPPAKFVIQNKDAQISFEYDPKKNSLQDLVNAAERLNAALHPTAV